MTNSRISDSMPLLYLGALVSSIYRGTRYFAIKAG